MENKGRMVRLAGYSRDCLKRYARRDGIEYEGRRRNAATLSHRTQQYETPP